MTHSNEKTQNTPNGDTIFAWATPPGRSGVAVLRLSGPQSLDILPILGVDKTLQPRHATLTTLKNDEFGIIDNCLALYFAAPHSFTGEDCLELHTHGSRAVVEMLTKILLSCTFMRLAEPGEFAKRAFYNGKMDLVQAEGLADLIEADTALQHKQAHSLIAGHVSEHYDGLRESIIRVRAHIEAYVDFPDEDIPENTVEKMQNEVRDVIEAIDNALDSANHGQRIREGYRLAIIGPPNAGKSTLINLLAQRDVAITSPEAGTTRDAIEIHLDIAGYPIIAIDTAGLRDTDSDVENEGIRRSNIHKDQSDIILYVCDANDIAPAKDFAKSDNDNILFLFTKRDISPNVDTFTYPYLHTSLLEQNAQKDIRDFLLKGIEKSTPNTPSPIVTRQRHVSALQECRRYLESFLVEKPNELLAEELRLASVEIEKITGRIALDSILDVLFKEFCIGK